MKGNKIVGSINEVLERARKEMKIVNRDLRIFQEWVVSAFLKIEDDARRNNGKTLINDLEGYISQLRGLDIRDSELREHMEILIRKLQSFVKVYRESDMQGVFTNLDERMSALHLSVSNSLKETILKDLKGKYSGLRDIYAAIKREML